MRILHVQIPHWLGLLIGYGSKPEPDSLTATRYDGCHVTATLDEITSMTHDYRHGSGHFRDDNFGNVMKHFYEAQV